jgi:DNA repair photolyase
MHVHATTTEARSILTRTSGYLTTVASHSLQPYRGCSFGQSLCGVGCYVQHNRFLTGSAPWGSFVVAKTNAAALYRADNERERRWARARHGEFSIFMSSATDPFLPHEKTFGVSRSVLQEMAHAPPDLLILQTHTHLIMDCVDLITQLASRCRLRVHISVESDRERFAGFPAHASSVEKRLCAAQKLKKLGVRTVITVAPLLPICEPEKFFQRLSEVADAVVLDHFIGGDGSKNGTRTKKTMLPTLMASIDPTSPSLLYLERMVEIANRFLPGRVGVGIDGFAGRLTT